MSDYIYKHMHLFYTLHLSNEEVILCMTSQNNIWLISSLYDVKVLKNKIKRMI